MTPNPGRIPDVPKFHVEFEDPEIGLHGFVCIHGIGRDGSSGGMRCVPDVDREEVRLLARAMTFKYSFFDTPQGGAKAGLQVPYDATQDEKHRLIRAAARHLEPILRRANFWSPWTDMNFYGEELRIFFAEVGRNYTPNPTRNSSLRTAISAFWSLQATLSHYGLTSEGCRIAIEGFGSVASYLAPLLEAAGIKVVAASTHRGAIASDMGLDLRKVVELRQRCGNDWIHEPGDWEQISHDELFTRDADILVPCARVHSIGGDRASAIRAPRVVPIANVPCTDEALRVLDARGIEYVPDFVVNGGGILGHVDSVDHDFGPYFRDMYERMLRAAHRRDLPVRLLAEEAAHENYARIESEAYPRHSTSSVIARGLVRRGLAPRSLARSLEPDRNRRIYERVTSLFADD